MIFQGIDDNSLRPSSPGKITDIFNGLRKNRVFLHRYIDRVYSLTHGNGLLTADSVTATWNSLYEQIDMALYDESARWGDYRRDVHPYSSKGSLFTPDTYFQTERKRLLNEYFPKRPGKLISQLKAGIPRPMRPRYWSTAAIHMHGPQHTETRLEQAMR